MWEFSLVGVGLWAQRGASAGADCLLEGSWSLGEPIRRLPYPLPLGGVKKYGVESKGSRHCGPSSLPRLALGSVEGMALPELDLMRIKHWHDHNVPRHLWDQVKIEADVTDRNATIVVVRSPWDRQGDHTRFLITRLRHTKTAGLCSLYRRDHNLKFH